MDADRINILVVDDNAEDRQNLEAMILSSGSLPCLVTHADRLASCYKQIDKRGIDLVLLDLFLPESKGLDTLRRVRKKAPELPIIVLTRLDDKTTGIEAVREGAQDYLIKGDYDSKLLHHSIRYAIERKRVDIKLQNYAAELENSNEEYKRFAYVVSHDLRAPLRAMQGFSNTLLQRYSDKLDDIGQEYVRRIANAALRMDELIQDLLVYSRITTTDIQITRINLEECIDKALEQVGGEIKERQAHITIQRPLPQAVGNVSTLAQIIVNLVTNGIKFVAPEVKPDIRIWSEIFQGRVRLWVEDNGIGIEQENQERIFQVFERLHGTEAYPGTGIGLAIVNKGVQRLGGHVSVESEPGSGSRFWIELKK